MKINIQLKHKPWSEIYSTIDLTNVYKQCFKMVYVNLLLSEEESMDKIIKTFKKTAIISIADI